MTQPAFRLLAPLALMPLATSVSAQSTSYNAHCTPTASAYIVPAGGTVTLLANCVDADGLSQNGLPIPTGSVTWIVQIAGQSWNESIVGQTSLPNAPLTVVVPLIPGEVTYEVVSNGNGYGGPVNINAEEAPATVTITVTDPCAPPPAQGIGRAGPLAQKLVVGAETTCNNPTAATSSTVGQLTTPLTSVQTTQVLRNLDIADKRMRALRASRNTALLDLQGIPLPQSKNDDGSDARKQRFGLYVTGLGDYLRQNGTDTLSEFKSRTTSLSVGADYRLNDDWVFGGNLGYSRGKVDFTGSASEQKNRGTQTTVYGAWSLTPTTYLSATLSYEANRFELTRDDGNQQLSTATPKGHGVGLSLSAGRDYVIGPWSIGPYLRWDNVTSSVDAFDESGSASAVSVSAQRIRSDVLNAGAQTQYSVPVSWGIVLPYVRVEVSHRSDKTSNAASATLINGNTTVLIPNTADRSGTFGNVAVGVAGVNQGGWSWFADFESGVAQKGYQTRRYGLGLRFEL